MPNCSICGQPIEKLPSWLDDVEITFRCAVCAESTSHSPATDDGDDDAADAKNHDEEKEQEGDEDEEDDEEEKED